MSIIDRVGAALLIWAAITVVFNPFLESRRLRHLAIVLGLGATLCFVIGPSL